MRSSLIGRRTLIWAMVVLVLLSPFIITFMPFSKGGGEKPKPTELMAEAAMLANNSLQQLNRTLNLLEPDMGEINNTVVEAYEVSKALQDSANEIGADKGFPGLLKEAMGNYSLLANESAEGLLAVPSLYKGLVEAGKAFELAGMCRVDEALETYDEAKPFLEEAREELAEALGYGSSIDAEALLSMQHRDVAVNLTGQIAKALEMIDEINKFFSLLAHNKDAVKELCSGGKPSQQQAEELVKGIRGLKPCRAGLMGYQEAMVMEKLLYMLGKTPSQGEQGIGGDTGEGQGGHGAGYHAPSSDD